MELVRCDSAVSRQSLPLEVQDQVFLGSFPSAQHCW